MQEGGEIGNGCPAHGPRSPARRMAGSDGRDTGHVTRRSSEAIAALRRRCRGAARRYRAPTGRRHGASHRRERRDAADAADAERRHASAARRRRPATGSRSLPRGALLSCARPRLHHRQARARRRTACAARRPLRSGARRARHPVAVHRSAGVRRARGRLRIEPRQALSLARRHAVRLDAARARRRARPSRARATTSTRPGSRRSGYRWARARRGGSPRSTNASPPSPSSAAWPTSASSCARMHTTLTAST